MRRTLALTLTMLVMLGAAACGGSSEETGIRVVSPDDFHEIYQNQPEDMVVLDIRTPEEYAAGHLEGSVLIDFYEPDFADRLFELDPDVPYLIYCRSGNRSGQTRAMMQEMEFTNVVDVRGGINAYVAAGHPLVS